MRYWFGGRARGNVKIRKKDDNTYLVRKRITIEKEPFSVLDSEGWMEV